MPKPKAADEVLRGPAKSKTVFPVLVLHFLEQGPDHGYGLMQRIDALCAGLLAVNTNTIYPLLRRLEERGFITGEWEHPTKRSRRLYKMKKSPMNVGQFVCEPSVLLPGAYMFSQRQRAGELNLPP